ncbi:MAG: hypothetical protein OXC28_05545 [Defluviicoccus sp.]|nr:hypothetical protein [Defluviicoccus sp.]
MAVAFDTLTAARRMEEAGMKREQAEAVAQAVRSAAESGREELATKTDLAAVKAELKAGMAALRVEIKGDISGLRVEFVDRIQSGERRMHAAVFGVGGLLFAALKLVP